MSTKIPPQTSTEEDATSKKRTFYEVMMARLGWQLQSATDIDQKIGVWFQSAPVVMTLLVGLLAIKGESNGYVFLVAALGLVAFAAGLVLLYLAQRPRRFAHGMNWQDIADDVNNQDLPASEFHYRIAFYLGQDTISDNNETLAIKARRFNYAIASFSCASVLMLLAVLITLLIS